MRLRKGPEDHEHMRGDGAVDKKGGVRAEEYDEDLKRMAEEHREMNATGGCFVHIK